MLGAGNGVSWLQIMDWLDQQAAACGSGCSTINIGSSYEGRTLKVLKVCIINYFTGFLPQPFIKVSLIPFLAHLNLYDPIFYNVFVKIASLDSIAQSVEL